MALLLRIFPNPAKVSGSSGIFAGAGFLPDLQKTPDSGRIRYSPIDFVIDLILKTPVIHMQEKVFFCMYARGRLCQLQL